MNPWYVKSTDIDAQSGDDNYISVQTLVEEANTEYTMLVASDHWGPDRNPSTNPGEEPPRDARDSGSARLHSTQLETSSSNQP